ncbi:MAG: hypothetical protein ACI4F4_01655 [Lachnospiraceae bacterium]
MQMKEENNASKPTGLKMAGDEAAKLNEKRDIRDIEAWDFSKEEDPYYVTSAKSKLQREAKERHAITPSEIILKISHVLVYLAVIGEIITLAVICIQDNANIIYNLTDLKIVFIIVAAVLILDSVLVNFLFEQHAILILVAVILPFLYPALRWQCVTEKKGIGTITSFLYFLSICFTFGCIWTAHIDYGNLLTMEDRALQSQIVNTLDMQLENGVTLGEFLKEELDDEEISFQNDNQYSYICVEGKGAVYLKDDGFVSCMKKDVPTLLLFQILNGRTLKLCEVTIKDDELTETGVNNYFHWVTSY